MLPQWIDWTNADERAAEEALRVDQENHKRKCENCGRRVLRVGYCGTCDKILCMQCMDSPDHEEYHQRISPASASRTRESILNDDDLPF